MNPRVSVQTQPPADWDPNLYMKFEDERMLAARDLSGNELGEPVKGLRPKRQ